MKKVENVKRKINRREIELKTLMLQVGIKATDIAKETGLSKPMVTYYIQGKRNSEKLDRYFEELKNEYDEIMDRFIVQVRHVEENQRKIL